MTDNHKKKNRLMPAIVAAIVIVAFIAIQYSRQDSHNNTSSAKMRIVSLAPSVTEMLFALGLEDCIVGVTDRCDYPAQAKDIECVGGFGKPSVEKLLALYPDLVVTTDFENNDVAELLSKSGIKVLDLEIRDIKEMFRALREIGQATGRLQRAEEIAAQMQAELKTIAARFESIQPLQRPKVFVEIWYDPITTTGQGSFINEVITLAGGVNVAGNLKQAYPRINPEKVIEWDPDAIVLCYMGQEGSFASQLAGRIGWADISAVREGRIIEDILPDTILRPGPRLIEGIKMLNRNLYGTEVEKNAAGDMNE